MSTKPEQVLCIERAVFESEFGKAEGYIPDCGLWLNILRYENLRWFPRRYCENRPRLKQLIPYCILTSEQGEVYAYQRTKTVGEQRLAGLWSVGIGGHINMLDAWDVNEGLDMVDRAVQREVNEEVILSDGLKSWMYVGLLNSCENPVDKVHLGLVFTIKTKGCVVDNTTEHIQGRFFSVEELKQELKQFEEWSKMLIPHLDGIVEMSRGKA